MKKIKILTIILIIILISMISFGGIYISTHGIMENKIKDYSYEMNLSEYRQVDLVPEKSEDSEENLKDKIEISKKIIEKRFETNGITNYVIRSNDESIVIEIPEDDKAETIISNITSQGKFEIIDSNTKEVLMNNEDLKTSQILAQSTEKGTMIYLSIEFKNEARQKLEDLTVKYRTLTEQELAALSTTENSTEEVASEEKTSESTEETKATQPKVTLQLDGNEMTSQSFDETIKTGKLTLGLSSATTSTKKIQSEIKRGNNIASILANGMMPVKFDVTHNETVKTNITNEMLLIFSLVICAVFAVALVILIIKYKKPALLASISFVGFAAVYLLVIRYANVSLSIEGIGGIILVMILNYILLKKMLDNKIVMDSYKEFILELIPVLIAIIVFCFTKWANIASFGMIMFWGLVIILVYNLIITKTLLKISAEK